MRKCNHELQVAYLNKPTKEFREWINSHQNYEFLNAKKDKIREKSNGKTWKLLNLKNTTPSWVEVDE